MLLLVFCALALPVPRRLFLFYRINLDVLFSSVLLETKRIEIEIKKTLTVEKDVVHDRGARERLDASQLQRPVFRQRHRGAEVLLVLDGLRRRQRHVERADAGRGPPGGRVEGRRRRRLGVDSGDDVSSEADKCNESDDAHERRGSSKAAAMIRREESRRPPRPSSGLLAVAA